MDFKRFAEAAPGQTTAVELKDRILSLIVEFPRPCGLVARRLLATREGALKLALACDAIGFEYARQILDPVTASQWSAMDALLRENIFGLASVPVASRLLEVYKLLVAECMSWDPRRHVDDPFDFLHGMADARVAALLVSEDPSELAFLAVFRTPDEMGRLLGLLPPNVRRPVVLRICRLERLPAEAVREAAIRFGARLKARSTRDEITEIRPDTPAETFALQENHPVSEAVTRMIAGSRAGHEAEAGLLEFFAREAPALAAKVRDAIRGTGPGPRVDQANDVAENAAPAEESEPSL